MVQILFLYSNNFKTKQNELNLKQKLLTDAKKQELMKTYWTIAWSLDQPLCFPI